MSERLTVLFPVGLFWGCLGARLFVSGCEFLHFVCRRLRASDKERERDDITDAQSQVLDA